MQNNGLKIIPAGSTGPAPISNDIRLGADYPGLEILIEFLTAFPKINRVGLDILICKE